MTELISFGLQLPILKTKKLEITFQRHAPGSTDITIYSHYSDLSYLYLVQGLLVKNKGFNGPAVIKS